MKKKLLTAAVLILIAVSRLLAAPNDPVNSSWSPDAYFLNMSASQAQEAMKYFERAVELGVKDEKIWFEIGGLLERFDKNDEAKICYSKLIDEDIKNVRAAFIRAQNVYLKYREHKWSHFCDRALPIVAQAVKMELLNIKDPERKMRARNRVASRTQNEFYFKRSGDRQPGGRKQVSRYDTEENLILLEVYETSEVLTSKTIYDHDENNFVIRETLCGADEKPFKILDHGYGFDKDGFPVYEVCIDGDGRAEWKTEYAYNISAHMVEFFEKRFDPNKNKTGEYQCMYDYLGYPVYLAVTDALGVASVTYDKRYHRVDHIIYYEHDGIMIRHGHFYEYDDYGNVVKKTVKIPEIKVGAPFKHEKVDKVGVYKYKYDPYGNLTEETCFDEKGDAVYKTDYLYEFR